MKTYEKESEEETKRMKAEGDINTNGEGERRYNKEKREKIHRQ